MSFETVANELIEAGRTLYQAGMVPATSGNFSARVDKNEIAITVSGRHKGKLNSEDIMRIDSNGTSLDGKKSSAETGLHTQIYKRINESMVVLHVHSMSSTLISRAVEDMLIIENYELIKAFPGIDTHESKIDIPVFDNDQDIKRLADKVDDYMLNHELFPAYLIRGHGLYTWGNSMEETMNFIEALDFLFKCELAEKRGHQ